MELFNIYIRVKDQKAQIKHALDQSQIEEFINAIKDGNKSILLDGKMIYLWNYEVINIFDVSKSLNQTDKAALKNEMYLLKWNLTGISLLSSFGNDVTHKFKIPGPYIPPSSVSDINDHDFILNTANDEGFVSFSKDSPSSILRARQQLIVFNLIIEKGRSFVLTKEGYKAIEVGGYQAWREMEKSKTVTPNIAFDNVSIINGDGNKINQNSVKGKTNSTKHSWIEIISWIVGIIVGGITIYQFLK